MGAPITWQNINGASLADASRPMEIAQRSFNGAFDNLRGLLTENRAIDEANWQNGKANNTAAFRASLLQAATPEQYQAPEAVAARQAMLQGFGAQIDQTAALEAMDSRGGVLKNRAEGDIRYNNAVSDAKSQPLEDAYKAAVLRKDQPAADAILAQYTGRHSSDMAQFADANAQLGKTRLHDDQRFSSDMSTAQQQRLLSQSTINTQAAQTQDSAARLLLAQDEAKAQREDKSAKRLADAHDRLTKLKTDDASTAAGMEEINKFIKTNYSDESTQNNLRARAIDAVKKGVFNDKGERIPITIGAMLQAISGTEDTRWYGTKWANSSDQGDYIYGNLKSAMMNPDYANAQTEAELTRRRLTDQLGITKPTDAGQSMHEAVKGYGRTSNPKAVDELATSLRRALDRKDVENPFAKYKTER